MYIPAARERVEIAGRTGVFLVVYVDREEQSVDLLSLSARAYRAENIPFALLRPCRGEGPPDPLNAGAVKM